jgi:SAM-dependent methyltransferase
VDWRKYLQPSPTACQDDLLKQERALPSRATKEKTFDRLPGPTLSDGTPRCLLDVGTAGGWSLSKLRDVGYTVMGITLFEEEAEILRGRDLPVRVCDMHELPKGWAGRYHVVRASNVLEHSPAPYIAISEFARVLTPEGVLQICMPNADGHTRLGTQPRFPTRMGSFGCHLFCGSCETVIELLRHPRLHLQFDGYYEDAVYDNGLLQYANRTWMAHKRPGEDTGDWFRDHEWHVERRRAAAAGTEEAY